MSNLIDEIDLIVKDLKAEFIRNTGVDINLYSIEYAFLNAFAKTLALQKIYNENEFEKKILLERQNLEELQETGSISGQQLTPATSSSGFAIIHGTINNTIPAQTEFTDNINTFQVLQDATITNYVFSISSITRSGTTATVKTNLNHNFATGMLLNITGANESNFNKSDVAISVISSDEFAYEVEDTGSTTATGTLLCNSDYALLNLLCNDSGIATNKEDGTLLNITSQLVDIESTCIVNYDGLTGGVEVETEESYRQRIQTKFANNTEIYTTALLPTTLKTHFPEIQQVSIVKDYSLFMNVSQIRKLTTEEKILFTQYNNDLYRVVEVDQDYISLPHRMLIKIIGSDVASLNVPTTAEPDAKVYMKLDTDKIIIYVGNDTDEDLVCTNTKISSYSPVSNLFILNKTDNKYPTTSQLDLYKNYVDEIVPFSYYTLSSFQKKEVLFEISNVVPNNSSLKSAIKQNLEDYFHNVVEGGKSIQEFKYITIVFNSTSGENTVEGADIICKVNGSITSDIQVEVFEYPELIDVVLT